MRVWYLAILLVTCWKRRVGKGVELHLGDGTKSLYRQTQGRCRNSGFSQRGIEDSFDAEFFLQPIGNAENAAKLAHILAKDQNTIV